MCQTILVFFCKINTRKKWEFKLAERDYIFFRFLTFLQVIVRKKGVLLLVVGMKKQMKQNAKTAESKIFIAFILQFHAKKIRPQLRSQKFAYRNLMYYFRWITKIEHGFSNIIDVVKARIRRIANSPTIDLACQVITDLQEWDRYNDKLKGWFEGILTFNHFFLLQNEFESQFYWLIYILVLIIRG